VSLTILIPATPDLVDLHINIASAPVEPTLSKNEHSKDLCEYDSDGVHIREERSAATPALTESLRYVSQDSYRTEDVWLEEGNIAIIHPLVKCTGLRVPTRPPTPLTAEEENDFLKTRDYRRKSQMSYFWSMNTIVCT
jgi:hypothetical protein